MHEDAPVLTAKKRERTGSRYSRRERENGGLPAVVYGHKQEPAHVTLDAKDAISHIEKGEKVFQLRVEGEDAQEFVLVKDLQFDYLGTNIVHCDLERVDLDERVHVRVPVHLIGEAKGLKKSGATLMHPVTELDIECAVFNLPDYLEVDISQLDVGGSIRASQVPLPAKTMKLLTDPDAEVAHIIHGGAHDEGDEAGEVGGQAAPEVITEKKPAE